MDNNTVKIFGHSVHPILIVFPLGLLATGTIFDVIYLATHQPLFATVAFWMITAGLIGGLLAAVFGFVDWMGIPSGTRAKSVGMYHGLANLLVVILYGASWFLRYNDPARPELAASVLTIIGAGVALVGGWLGGELVERLGIAVHEGANVDAPSSLSTDTVPGAARSTAARR
ncbi:MAG: DUF2231 domain-containing protein [Acidobacteria bacterium]|nr:DUF2231 domain-containing protein [Acidobacteriota bacterium]